MPRIPVEALSFTFDDDWLASKYDDWSFYRNRFRKIRDQVKAIDLLAIEGLRYPGGAPTTAQEISRI